MRAVEVACRLLIAAVFVAALAGKASSRLAYSGFVRSLREMAVLPADAVRTAALLSVLTEALVVVLMLTPFRLAAMAGFVVAAGLLAVFTMVIARSLRRGDRTPCRCFGVATTPLGREHIVRNIGLIAVCAVGAASTLSGGQLHLGLGADCGIRGAGRGPGGGRAGRHRRLGTKPALAS